MFPTATADNREQGHRAFYFHLIGWLIDLIDMYACGHMYGVQRTTFGT